MNKCQNCRHASICSKFSPLYFCQILFELVYSWESYHKNKKGGLFIEAQCSVDAVQMSGVRLFYAVRLATENARLPTCRLVD